MTGNISRKMKILRAVIFTASLVWAGLPVKTAAEGTTNEEIFELIDEMPKTVTFSYVPRIIKDETTSQGWWYADEHYTIRLTGSYKAYKNTRNNYYYYYFSIRGTQIMPANMSSQSKKNTAGPYDYPYGILKYAIRWENEVAFDGYLAVSNYYQGEQLVFIKSSSIFYRLENLPVNFNSTNGELIYWNYYNSQNSGSSGTDAETAQNITNILNELKADPAVQEDLTATEEQISTTTNEAIEAETTLTNGAKEAFEAIAPEQIINKIERLQSAMEWVRKTHNKFITSNIFGDYLALCLIIGFAAYLIGKGT